jgi:hypothetical protein
MTQLAQWIIQVLKGQQHIVKYTDPIDSMHKHFSLRMGHMFHFQCRLDDKHIVLQKYDHIFKGQPSL